MMRYLLALRPAVRRIVSAALLALLVSGVLPHALAAQTTADPQAPATADDANPDTAKPEAGPPQDSDPQEPGAEDSPGSGMSSPPVVDPKSVETQKVPGAGEAAAVADPAEPGDPLKRPDGFGELVELKPAPVLVKKGQSSWDEGFASIVAAVKAADDEITRLKLKPVGAPLVVYSSTDDAGFNFEVAMPFEGATTDKPGEGFEFSASPAGRAMRFTHRGSYDAMDPTYEQIANLLDAKDLEAQDLYIEQYRSDPRTTSQDDLVIDIFVPLK